MGLGKVDNWNRPPRTVVTELNLTECKEQLDNECSQTEVQMVSVMFVGESMCHIYSVFECFQECLFSIITCYWKSDIATEEVLLTMQAELALAVLSPVEGLRSLSQPGEADGFTLQGLMLERSEEIIAKHKVTNPNH
ncbi:hypothetical protein HGM15179_005022 [Zosterops borbonicus]|uniref:Uncharacterized protein n=1 Tax=Zosterops borbonicus TaxID=364589 RepID=A0A8K1GQ90_9PASS|nr:hypothetical protein HGM15179_005022 [Zosterops borbonicus]